MGSSVLSYEGRCGFGVASVSFFLFLFFFLSFPFIKGAHVHGCISKQHSPLQVSSEKEEKPWPSCQEGREIRIWSFSSNALSPDRTEPLGT